jgi:hypothetical protein
MGQYHFRLNTVFAGTDFNMFEMAPIFLLIFVLGFAVHELAVCQCHVLKH